MIKTILCDLGNVIVNIDHDKIIRNLAKCSNRSEKQIHDFFASSKEVKDFEKGRISFNNLFRIFKNNLNLKIDSNKFKKAWNSCFIGINKDVEKLLYKLKKRYNLILLSNTNKIHFNYIKSKCKVLEIFDGFMLSYKVGYVKPNPMIFLKAIKMAKTAPRQIFFIDDIYSHISMARFFRIRAAQYTNFNNLKIDLRKNNIKF